LKLPEHDITLPLEFTKKTTAALVAVVSDTIIVPANSEVETLAVVPDGHHTGTWLLECHPKMNSGIVVARAIVNSPSQVVIRLINTTSIPSTVHKGKKVALLSPLSNDQILVSTIEAFMVPPSISNTKKKCLWEIATRSNLLTATQQEQFYQLLLKYAEVFPDNNNDLGRTRTTTHTINTDGAKPIRQAPRCIPPHLQSEADNLIAQMLQQNIIQKSNSPWSSPIVLVKKKDGSIRFCVDYRKVNHITRKDAYPLPRIDDTLDTLSGAKWFTTLDLLSGYWQVEVAAEDKEKTAFVTRDGLYEFNVMPFGLCNAPATFQRLMDMVLSGLQWTHCLVYLDDVIVFSCDFTSHLDKLHQVFLRLQKAGLKVKPTKCVFFQKEVPFLGHIVSEHGIATDPAKIDKVAKWPTPVSRHQLQQFLGLANYYRRFIKDFATICRPLHKLTEKSAPFKWTDECQYAFQTLRNKLVSPPVLVFPEFSKEFILDTDASDSGIGAVLSQIDDRGQERVVAYASRALSKAERNYSVTRKELLAMVTFTFHFRQYLLGRTFTLRTDHSSLTWLKNFRHPEGQLARWLEKLQEFTFTIQHRAGHRDTPMLIPYPV
jgi:hypothetical protein